MSSVQGMEKAVHGGGEAKERGYEGDLSSVPVAKNTEGEMSSESETQPGKASQEAENADRHPSLFQKLKGRFLGAEANAPAPASAKKPDHSAKAGILTHVQQSLWGKTEDPAGSKATPAAADAAGEGSGSSRVPISVPPTVAKAKDGGPGSPVSDELGTGYEEDTERSALSSESSADFSGKADDFAPQPESVFKPVAEAKDNTELSIEDLRQRKAADNVQAPGVAGRAYEEVEAVADQVLDGLSLKGNK